MIAADVRTETSRLLAELIRIDTSNPPGNETAAAEHLAAYLAEAGVKSELVGREPHRASLIARLPGTGDGPSLMLLGHTDVVGADADEWSVPPFSGLERDGFVWGRGALDMKGQVAAEAVAVATLAREGGEARATSSCARSPTRRLATTGASHGSSRSTPTSSARTTS